MFLLVQLVAYATRDDDFWSVPAGIVAHVVEWFAGLGDARRRPPDPPRPRLRHDQHGDGPRHPRARRRLARGRPSARLPRRLVLAAVATAICVASAVASATAVGPRPRPHADGDRRPGGPQRPSGRLDGGGARRLVGPRRRHRLDRHPRGRRRGRHPRAGRGGGAPLERARPPTSSAADVAEQWAWLLSAVALVPGAIAMGVFIGQTGEVVAGLIGGAVTGDRRRDRARPGTRHRNAPARHARPHRLGCRAGRCGRAARRAARRLSPSPSAPSRSLDALRLRDPHVALGASLAVPVAIGALARTVELSVPASGVALSISAAVLVGLGLAGRPPLVAADPRRRRGGLCRRSRARRPRRQRLRRRRDDHQWHRARGVRRAGPSRRRPPRFAGHDRWHLAPSRRRRGHRQRAVPGSRSPCCSSAPGCGPARSARAAGSPTDRSSRSSVVPPSPSG